MGAHAPNRPGSLVTVFSMAVFCAPVLAQEHPAAAPPGFRPASEYVATFIECLDDASLIVLPTVLRGLDGADHSTASQRLIVDLLGERGLAAQATDERIDLGAPPHAPQWDLFNGALRTI